MSDTSPGHQPRYFTPPGHDSAGEHFACGVTCSCGRFNQVARSKKSHATAEANARRQHARHVEEAVAVDEQTAMIEQRTKSWTAARPPTAPISANAVKGSKTQPPATTAGEWTSTESQARAIRIGTVAASMAFLGLIVWGVGSLFGIWPTAEERAAGDACESWAWDSDLNAGENEERLGDTFRDHDAHFADAYEEMRDQCPALLREYTAAIDDMHEGDVRAAGPADSMEEELEFAEGQHSCTELKAWYSSNPGDSNPNIAGDYWRTCGATPPPVASGELPPSSVPGLAASLPECPSPKELKLTARNGRPNKSDEREWVFDIWATNPEPYPVYVWSGVIYDWELGRAGEERFLEAFEIPAGADGYVYTDSEYGMSNATNIKFANWFVLDKPQLNPETFTRCRPNVFSGKHVNLDYLE